MGAAAGALCLLCLLCLCLSPHPAAAFQSHLQRTTPRGRALLKAAAGVGGGDGVSQASHIRRVCVIGGGAAGFMAAIEAGRGLRGVAGAEVVLLEGTKKVLHKVSISGGGRCNVMHSHRKSPQEIAQNYPRGQRELLGPLTSAFGPKEAYEWFTSMGVTLKTEADGRMFPTTDSSQTIIDCLRRAAAEAGVRVETGAKARAITPTATGNGLTVSVERASSDPPEPLPCACVLLATGSDRKAHAMAQALGHSITPPVPSLFTFELGKGGGSTNPLQGLAGISVGMVEVRLLGPAGGVGGAKALKETLKQAGLNRNQQGQALSQRGPLLITHSGLSGPATLRLSAFGARVLHVLDYKARIAIDWAPDLEAEAVAERLARAKAAFAKKAVATFCPLPLPGTEDNPDGPEPRLPRRLWARLVASAGLGGGGEQEDGDAGATWGAASPKALTLLAERVKGFVVDTAGKGAFKDEFVSAGGVSLGELDLKSMQSKLVPGLFVAGEAADYDGVTGGFNFQGCWTTGFLAGRAMARRVRGEERG